MGNSPQIARLQYLAWRSERNKRSYDGKVDRGECGHCSEPLAPGSKSCCVKHLEYYREKVRQARDRKSPGTALAARTSKFPSPSEVRNPAQCPIMDIFVSALEKLPTSVSKYIALKPELDSCWHWTGQTVCNPRYHKNQEGQQYGIYTRKVRRSGGGWITKGSPAHRFIYEALIGPVPAKRDLDHLCENKLCVNPSHLEPVTRQENMIRYFMRRGL